MFLEGAFGLIGRVSSFFLLFSSNGTRMPLTPDRPNQDPLGQRTTTASRTSLWNLRGWDEGGAGELNNQRVCEDFLEVGLVGDPALVGPGLELVEHPDGHTQ